MEDDKALAVPRGSMRRGPPDIDLQYVPSGTRGLMRGVGIIFCVILSRLYVGCLIKDQYSTNLPFVSQDRDALLS